MLAAIFVVGAVVLGLRYWVLPNIDDFRDDIARAVSNASRQHISIGKISGNWDGLRPRLVLENVMVYDQAGPARARADARRQHAVVAIARDHAGAAFMRSTSTIPMLDVRRDAQGGVWVAGIEVDASASSEGGGFAEWLLDQPDIEIHDAALRWTDELRGAPPLVAEARQPPAREPRPASSLRPAGRSAFGNRARPRHPRRPARPQPGCVVRMERPGVRAARLHRHRGLAHLGAVPGGVSARLGCFAHVAHLRSGRAHAGRCRCDPRRRANAAAAKICPSSSWKRSTGVSAGRRCSTATRSARPG